MPGIRRGRAAVIAGATALIVGAGASQASAQISIYSSQPLKGSSSRNGQSILRAEKLALKQAGGKVGALTVTLKSLNDATAKTGTYDPRRCAVNPLTASEDSSAVAYIGDFATRCDLISAPIANEVGIGQISTGGTLASLTRSGKQFRVRSERTYLRVIAADHLQAKALTSELRQRGVRRVYVVGNADEYGTYLRDSVRTRARAAGIKVVGRGTYKGGSNPKGLARSVKRSGAQTVVFAGVGSRGGAAFLNALARIAPRVKILASDAVAQANFISMMSRAARARTSVTTQAIAPSHLGSRGRAFTSAYRAAYGGESPAPYAAYGYEAMRLALDAIARAGDSAADRNVVREMLLTGKRRSSIFGAFSIDKNGDTDRGVFGAYSISSGGKLKFSRVVRVS